MNEKILMAMIPMLVKAFNLPPDMPEILAARFQSMQKFLLDFCDKYDARLCAVEESNLRIEKNQQEMLEILRALHRDQYGSDPKPVSKEFGIALDNIYESN